MFGLGNGWGGGGVQNFSLVHFFAVSRTPISKNQQIFLSAIMMLSSLLQQKLASVIKQVYQVHLRSFHLPNNVIGVLSE